jgi:putative YhbY family RNA-binding protein
MINLTPVQRRELRAKAHALSPVVSIGDAGLSEAVLKEITLALAHHELIKIKVHGGDREAREAMQLEICEKLDAAPVQHIGKILVIWKQGEKPAAPAPVRAAAKKKPAERKTETAPRRPASRPSASREARAGRGESAARPRRDESAPRRRVVRAPATSRRG